MKKLVVISDRAYVPKQFVTRAHLEAYTKRYEQRNVEMLRGDPKACGYCIHWQKPWGAKKRKQCHLVGYTETDMCKDFEHRTITTVSEVEIQSYTELKNAYAFARGDLTLLQNTFHDFEFDDQRSAPPLGFDLQFKPGLSLRPDQLEPVNTWLKAGHGILKAPTASGKSVMLLWIICQLKVRTIILSHETRHLDLLKERLYEFTNIADLEREHNTQIAGYFKHGEGNFPFMFSTFQSLYSKLGQLAIEGISDGYGLLWVDEAHHSAAVTFHNVFSSLNTFYRGGTTATPTRKDQFHHALYKSLGPVTAEGHKHMLLCEVTWVHTGIEVPAHLFRYSQYGWSKMQTWLAANDQLNLLILDLVLADIEAGRKVLIILERRQQVFTLNQQIQAAGYNVELVMGGTTVSNYADLNQRLIDGKTHCVIGTKVINENIDIPALDCVHLPTPSANDEMEEQRVGRVRRPSDGKIENPLVRVYCYEGPSIVKIQEYTRKRVYTKLGFLFPEVAQAPSQVQNLATFKNTMKSFGDTKPDKTKT